GILSRWTTASIGGLGGNRTLISWVQARDPPVERRAHSGEDNGARTRTAALTTRCLSLRLCPLQNGPSGGIRTHRARRRRRGGRVWTDCVCHFRHAGNG